MGGTQLVVVQFHLLFPGDAFPGFLLQTADPCFLFLRFLEQFLPDICRQAAVFGQHCLAEIMFLQQMLHFTVGLFISQHHHGLPVLGHPIQAHIRQEAADGLLEFRQFFFRQESHMAAGGFRKAQLFQGNVQFQPGIQAFRLGPEGRRFTFQGSDLAGGGIQFFRQLPAFLGLFQEIPIGNGFFLGKQGILGTILDQELEHLTGFIQLGADFF